MELKKLIFWDEFPKLIGYDNNYYILARRVDVSGGLPRNLPQAKLKISPDGKTINFKRKRVFISKLKATGREYEGSFNEKE